MNKLYFGRNFFLIHWRHTRRKNTIAISSIYWNVLLCIFSNCLKIRILLIFSLVKSNIKWFTRSFSWISCSSVFTKTTCVVTRSCLVSIQLRFASLSINYLEWIISDIKQKAMEYLLIITLQNILFLTDSLTNGWGND